MRENQLLEELTELCRWEALELNRIREEDGTDSVLIPYVMNDAAECYYILHDCRVMGEWEMSDAVWTEVDCLHHDTLKGILLRKDDGTVVTIWYQTAAKEVHCYQYHQIGHNWRTAKGEEHWRRVVNLLCVLHDKYTYLGEAACNETELQLCHLAEFAPVRYWTPINESIDSWYPDTQEGIDAMRKIVIEAGDQEFLWQLEKYENNFQKGKKKQALVAKLAALLNHPEHRKIFEMITCKMMEASNMWPKRSYGAEKDEQIRNIRQTMEQSCQKNGYKGNYPVFRKEDQVTGKIMEKHFVEEHPFTVLESEEYQFRIFVLESEGSGSGCETIDFGFFWGKHISLLDIVEERIPALNHDSGPFAGNDDRTS